MLEVLIVSLIYRASILVECLYNVSDLYIKLFLSLLPFFASLAPPTDQ